MPKKKSEKKDSATGNWVVDAILEGLVIGLESFIYEKAGIRQVHVHHRRRRR